MLSPDPSGEEPAASTGQEHLIVLGREGWLFLQRDTNEGLRQHTGVIKLGRLARRRWRSLLARRTELQGKLGFTWAMEIVPDKEAAYAEFLPPSVIPVPRRPVHRILDLAAETGAPAHYLLDDLEAGKGETELYSKTDTHWNHRGAFVAYQSICRRLADRGIELRALDESDVLWSERDLAQDLGEKLFPQRRSRLIRADLLEHHSVMIFDNRIRGRSRVMLFEQPDSSLPTALLCGESFAFQTLLFLKESFSRLAFIHTSTMPEEIIAAERPDVVLSLPVERFMIKPPDDFDALTKIEQIAIEKAIRADVHYGKDGFIYAMPHDQDRLDRVFTSTIPWR